MSNVAIAGGLGDLGRTFIDGIQEMTPHHRVFILTRKSSGGQTRSPPPSNTTVVELDYSDISSIASILRHHSIDTVISTLNLDFQQIANAQINLIRGAAESGSVKRFVPSDFNVDYSLDDEVLPYPEKIFHRHARAELEKYADADADADADGKMVFCSIQPGMFMDYYGLPHCKSYMKPLYILVDIPSRTAVLPGDGNAVMAFTYTIDLGRYIALLLDLPAEKWPRDVICIGERIAGNALVRMVEEVLGTPFTVTYDSVAALEANKPTVLPSNRAFHDLFPGGMEQVAELNSHLGLAYARGAYDIQAEVSLNDMFPEVKPVGMRQFLHQCWDGKE